MRYIDVSEHQGVIDWAKVKDSIDGAILRAGYGTAGTPDKQFARNASECNRLGIPIGAYWFSYAKDAAGAAREAAYLLTAVRPYRMDLPLAYDFEYDSVQNAARAGVTVTKDLATDMAYAFCKAIEDGGYFVMNYANADYLSRYFDAQRMSRFALWYAAWPAAKVIDPSKPPRTCAIWQWSSIGRVPGISGPVDMDESYYDFAGLIAGAGLNHIKSPESNAPQSDAAALAERLGLEPDAPVTGLELARALLEFRKEEQA